MNRPNRIEDLRIDADKTQLEIAMNITMSLLIIFSEFQITDVILTSKSDLDNIKH